jgi:hypothetical protein
MSEEAARNTTATGKYVITLEKSAELRRLYGQLPNAAFAAREALRNAGDPLIGVAFERFRELDARVVRIIDRIKQILA